MLLKVIDHDPNLLAKWCATVLAHSSFTSRNLSFRYAIHDILFALVITIEGARPTPAVSTSSLIEMSLIGFWENSERKASVKC